MAYYASGRESKRIKNKTMTIKNYKNTCKRIVKLVSASPASDGYQDIAINTKVGNIPSGYITETIPSVPNEVVEKMLGMGEIEFTVTYEAHDTSYPKRNQTLYFYASEIREMGTGNLLSKTEGLIESQKIETANDFNDIRKMIKENDMTTFKDADKFHFEKLDHCIVSLSRIHN